MSNAHKSEAFTPPGQRLAQVGRYTIYESADPDAPPGCVEVFEGEPCGRNRVVQMGLVVREILVELWLTQDDLRDVHAHVKEALIALGVDVSVDCYIPDSWTLVEQCRIAWQSGQVARSLAELAQRSTYMVPAIAVYKGGDLWRVFDLARDEWYPARPTPQQAIKAAIEATNGIE